MAKSYKALKEDFVSNLAGGDISEINFVTAVAPVAVLLWSLLQSRLSFFTPYTPLAFIIDFLLNVGAILLVTTLYASAPLLLSILLLSPAALLYLLPPSLSLQKKPQVPPPRTVSAVGPDSHGSGTAPEYDQLPRKPFITNYRGGMMVITCLAILAVDFRVFPRRFAKVENWGTSLMDLGVGSFVFSAGLVAARPILKERLQNFRTPLTKRLFLSLKNSLPLFVLGLVRLYSVKGLDYAEHVSEYGVHWNFFFTLALLPPFTALCHTAFSVIPSYALLSFLLGSIYQILLESTDLKAYVLLAPRTSLLSKNREGVFSFFGYLSIFLAGQATGVHILPRDAVSVEGTSAEEKQRTSSWRSKLTATFKANRAVCLLVLWSGIWTALYQVTSSPIYGLSYSVSRRLANLPYVLWINAFNVTQILSFYLVERVAFPVGRRQTPNRSPASVTSEKERHARRSSKVLASFNRNALAIFLLANLLTGGVNLTIPTLMVGRTTAMAILASYSLVLASVAMTLDVYNIDIKL
ncbi:MAG: Glucosaminyl phosphatidylinositol (GlcN-PI) nositol acylation protein [Caeruleum heppii]|nr:MAG: Glucosaminyl phosphatidylinositol (GlcN-PI) nositol acylation protein [Caeruleum heppii]